MTRNLDMMYTAVPSPKMEAAAAEILGPVWQAFIEESSQPLRRGISWEGTFYEIQAAADLAAKLRRKGNEMDARKIYELICAEMPEHGDAHYHLAWLVADENIARSLELIEITKRLLPGHPPYERAEFEILVSKGLLRFGEKILSAQNAYLDAVELQHSTPDKAQALFAAIQKAFPGYSGGDAPAPPATPPFLSGRTYSDRVIERARSIGRRLIGP